MTVAYLLKHDKFGSNFVLIKQNLPNSIILPPKNGGFKARSHSVRKANALPSSPRPHPTPSPPAPELCKISRLPGCGHTQNIFLRLSKYTSNIRNKSSVNQETNLHRFKSNDFRMSFEIFQQQFLDNLFFFSGSTHFKFFAQFIRVRLRM